VLPPSGLGDQIAHGRTPGGAMTGENAVQFGSEVMIPQSADNLPRSAKSPKFSCTGDILG